MTCLRIPFTDRQRMNAVSSTPPTFTLEIGLFLDSQALIIVDTRAFVATNISSFLSFHFWDHSGNFNPLAT